MEIKLKFIPTEETIIKNDFINSLGAYKESLIFFKYIWIFYSINNEKIKINWFVNLNQSLDLNPTNLFYSKPIMVS